MITGRFVAATRPANPPPIGILTPATTSSSIPKGGARDELVGLAVEQQYRAGVGDENVADPRQQHVEQLVELEMRKRRIGHGLHVLDSPPRVPLRFEQSRMLDRHRRSIGRQLQQIDIVVVEPAPMQRADVEHADHPAGDEQRHAHHRLDPLLPQDRVQHLGRIDVVEHHRPLGGGDTAREPSADGDPHPGLDLFLDPDRRSRDQLVRLLVDEQDGAGVGAEDVADPRQQHVQQFLDLEMRKRSVGNSLEPLQPVGARVEAPLHQLDILVQQMPCGLAVETASVRGIRMWTEPLAEAVCQGDRQVVALRRVEPVVPHENVEALDLLDQKDNRPACGGYLETRVLLEARTPSPQLFELVRAEPSLLHRSTLLACLTRCEPQRECADRAPRRGCRRPGSTP